MKIFLIIVFVMSFVVPAFGEEEPTMEDLPGGTPGVVKISELTTKLSMAEALIGAGNPEKALDVISEVEALDVFGSYSAECLYYRGFAYNQMGDLESAENFYLEALSESPDNTMVMLGLAQTYLDAEKYDDAERFFSDALAVNPDDPTALTGMGYLSILAGDGEAAKGYLERAVGADPKEDLAYSYLGLIAMQERDYGAAQAYLEKAVSLDPGNITANYNLASIYFSNEDYASAAEHYSAVVNRVPDDYEARYYLALSFEALGMYDEAQEQVDAIIDGGGDIPGVVELEMRLNEKLGGGK
jgi:tetratricopeptide (TPR) repeat protein